MQNVTRFERERLSEFVAVWQSTTGTNLVMHVESGNGVIAMFDTPRTWDADGWPRNFKIVHPPDPLASTKLRLPDRWRAIPAADRLTFAFRERMSTRVRAVDPGGTMARAGVRDGDRIVRVDGREVASEERVVAGGAQAAVR